MAKQSKRFTVDVTLSKQYGSDKGKVIGYARVSGVGYWDKNYQTDWDAKDCELEDIASFDVESVLLKVGTTEENGRLAYDIDKALGGDFHEAIDNPVLAHMEYLFSEHCEKHNNEEIEFAECVMCAIGHTRDIELSEATDLDRHIPIPTVKEIEQIVNRKDAA
jgi:hypothetical protein